MVPRQGVLLLRPINAAAIEKFQGVLRQKNAGLLYKSYNDSIVSNVVKPVATDASTTELPYIDLTEPADHLVSLKCF